MRLPTDNLEIREAPLSPNRLFEIVQAARESK